MRPHCVQIIESKAQVTFKVSFPKIWCIGILFLCKFLRWNKYPKTKTVKPSDGFLYLRETSLETRWEVNHFRLFFVFLVVGLVDLGWESLKLSIAHIMKKRCNFTLRWLLNLRNTSLEQNIRLKTLGYLLFIPAIFFICCFPSPCRLLSRKQSSLPDVNHCIWTINFWSKGDWN